MKKILLAYSIIIAFTLSLALITGCSEVKDNLTMAPAPEFHGDGWTNPSSSNFHGAYISSSNWDMNNCKSCHGSDFTGGTSGKSCYTCHENGPQACNLCHGNDNHIYPPRALNGNTLPSQQGVGAHEMHLTSDSTARISARVDCFECHAPVTSYSDPNHISKDGQNKAAVVFGDLAKTQTAGVTPNPQWNATTQTCSDVYCHGAFKNGNQSNAPSFIQPGTQGCGSCHGNPATGDPKPGGTHPQNYNQQQCWLCHGIVINPQGQIISKYRHINGEVNFSNK